MCWMLKFVYADYFDADHHKETVYTKEMIDELFEKYGREDIVGTGLSDDE